MNKEIKPIETREEFEAMMTAQMNPVPEKDFNPATFDPMKLNEHPHAEIGARERVQPPVRLPTLGMLPKKIREGQMVGMFESKQDLYLLIAALWNHVADLEETVQKLQGEKETP